jgi:predicted ATPase
VAALRSYLRSEPAGLEGLGVLGDQLALILPELGEPPAAGDRPALFEAVRFAFARAARDRCIVVILDDLQWSDEATLEMLSALAQPLGELSVLVIASYRSDGLSRDHGLRRLRNELRRAGLLDELALYPLSLEETTALLAQILGRTPSPSLVRAIHDRTEGIPFFIEELAAALRVSDSLKEGRRGLELVDGDEVPLPRTVRDAVLIGTADLSDEARAAVEVAAVAGESFDVDLVIGLSTDAGFSELVERGLIHEQEPGRAGFRHALTCEAIYADVPWIRRRTLHGELAEALDDAGAQSREVALHWLGARDSDRARSALVRAAADSEAVDAYRDAAAASSLGSLPRPRAPGESCARFAAPWVRANGWPMRSGGLPPFTS